MPPEIDPARAGVQTARQTKIGPVATFWMVAAVILAACGQVDETPRGCGLEGTAALPEGSAEIAYSCSPESSRRSESAIFVARPGEPARVITRGSGPSWSPDGRRIAFVSTRSGALEVHVMNADGTDVVQITHSRAFVRDVNWSPDGTRIVFSSGAAGLTGPLGVIQWPMDIYVVQADGTEARRLTRSGGFNVQPVWSPDGSRIAYCSDLGGPYEVWVMGSDGSGQRPMTRVGQNCSPSWSPDGSQIAFHSDRDYGDEGTIYVANADGSGERRLIDDSGIAPVWSRDGRWIAYWSDRGGPIELYAVHPDGSALTQLTHDGLGKSGMTWAPP
jgi:Tol biopolymer transport system component